MAWKDAWRDILRDFDPRTPRGRSRNMALLGAFVLALVVTTTALSPGTSPVPEGGGGRSEAADGSGSAGDAEDAAGAPDGSASPGGATDAADSGGPASPDGPTGGDGGAGGGGGTGSGGGGGGGGGSAPAADFTASCPSLTCSFNGSASHDPDGDIVNWTWQVDGATLHGERVEYTFLYAGNYTVTLDVRDAGGRTGSLDRWLEVTEDEDLLGPFLPEDPGGTDSLDGLPPTPTDDLLPDDDPLLP